MSDYVLYHANCLDGFCSAYVARKNLSADCIYVPVKYQEPIPSSLFISNHVADDLYILDFSYPPEDLVMLSKKFNRVFVLDHHKSAIDLYKDFDESKHANIKLTFDTSHSGAMLTWKHFAKEGDEPSLLVLHTEDRDLWRFSMKDTRAVMAYVRSFPKTFTSWAKLEHELDFDYEAFVEKGKAILRAENVIANTHANQAAIGIVSIDKKPVKFAYVNATTLMSEIGNLMCEIYDVSFALIYKILKNGKVLHSLRSKDKQDVALIAEEFGGGGHKNAAGFVLDKKVDWLQEAESHGSED